MDNKYDDIRRDLVISEKAKHEQYIYYILALTAACLAYSVDLTKDKTLNNVMIPLGIAILLWLISIVGGLRVLTLERKYSSQDLYKLHLMAGGDDFISNNPWLLPHGLKIADEVMEKTFAKIRFWSNTQLYCLYIGGVSFIVWRVISMLPQASI